MPASLATGEQAADREIFKASSVRDKSLTRGLTTLRKRRAEERGHNLTHNIFLPTVKARDMAGRPQLNLNSV